MRGAVLDAAGDQRVEGLTCGAYHEKIAEVLIEDVLGRHPGVDAAEHHSERVLAAGDSTSPVGGRIAVKWFTANPSFVSGHEPGERQTRLGWIV
ncbi:hypothetical protein Rhe02_22360 [Rhizocola hellebori]|uniref:Uncharacterized protein n=1 Tax=Rhizocola hellebori TaxID=1392758 RepID=A0A8J3Q5D1_9ACTN|nr:hypothetical protein Rhe02_22360 [Rhizocola hellebori]